ncbi:glycosyltransferase [Sandarakinorhabdus limnophila]|uniref:glycosyltransferase n=1 Tax=Sandarakinorhabdus limnophila TaxID=210512 RepID=UPI0031378F30
MMYLLSSVIGTERLPKFQQVSGYFGQAHYSWKINASLYRRALQEIRDIKDIVAPDIYQHELAREAAGIRNSDIHLIDKPVEHLRPLFGNKNVAIQVWEFPELSTQSHGGDPRLNQVEMLRKMDSVWCGSSFTADTMLSYGISAIHLPPPVSHFVIRDQEDLGHIPAVRLNSLDNHPVETEDLTAVLDGRDVYLSILAPFDRRKNIVNLIKGFCESQLSENSILLIKLVIDNVGTTVGNINDILSIHFDLKIKCQNIVFVGAYLSERQMSCLYNRASFYVSAASAEGLNLPLIEAMTLARPVIAPNNTAMRDYVSSKHAVVMEFESKTAEGPIHALHRFIETTHFPPSTIQVTDAFNRAGLMSRPDAASLGKRGARFVNSLFGMKAFGSRLRNFEKGL